MSILCRAVDETGHMDTDVKNEWYGKSVEQMRDSTLFLGIPSYVEKLPVAGFPYYRCSKCRYFSLVASPPRICRSDLLVSSTLRVCAARDGLI